MTRLDLIKRYCSEEHIDAYLYEVEAQKREMVNKDTLEFFKWKNLGDAIRGAFYIGQSLMGNDYWFEAINEYEKISL